MKKILTVIALMVIFTNICLTQEVTLGKKISIGPVLFYHSVSMEDYKNAKKEAAEYISFLLQLQGYQNVKYTISYPESFINFGLQLTYSVTKNITVSPRILLTSLSAKDEVKFEDYLGNSYNLIENWTFDINDIGIGLGYSLYDLLFPNSKEVFLLVLGNYSVKYTTKTEGNEKETETHSGNKIYFEIDWLSNWWLNKTKTISIDLTIGYKIVTFDQLGDLKDVNNKPVKFDFSGFVGSLGVSYWF